MRQLIIVRKDLQMSPGKLAAQCCHASMAFLTRSFQKEKISNNSDEVYNFSIPIQKEIYDSWISGTFTKTICEAKNKYQLLKSVAWANELGLMENLDYFFIKDSCLTELTPEEYDEDGYGRTLTCIGFRPLPDEIVHIISKKYQLYH